ncbi:MAG: alpha/beta hydrolase [Candidatus Lokiarchaeota archaeon]|nr:alpha/beta hydrolase [Candidatus Lokiarchaeota archaeon]
MASKHCWVVDARLDLNQGIHVVAWRDFEVRHGRSMSYEVYKPSLDGQGMHVICIHDWQASPGTFHGLVTCLDGLGLRCIIPRFDCNHPPNNGPNNVPGNGTRSCSWHESLLDLLEELHVDRFGIIAFGMFGGSIARHVMQALGMHRYTFVSLLSPGPCLIDTPARDAFWNMLPAETRARILDLPRDAIAAMASRAVDLFNLSGSARSRDELSADLDRLVDELVALSDTAPPKHGTCTVPVEVICGELDEVVPLELAFKTVRHFREVHVNVIPLAGHHFLEDFCEEAARCLQEFLVTRVARDTWDGIRSTS